MSEKDFRSVNAKYDQDAVNGITQAEYNSLFSFLAKEKVNSILDLAGGSGNLTKILLEKGYDAHLLDIATNMLQEAINRGIPKERIVDGDIFKYKPWKPFDSIIIKSATHEFSEDMLNSLHQIAYSHLSKNGIFIDWDVHQPDKECAEWFIKFVNLKDKIAGLDLLVKNRMIYAQQDIFESMTKSGFKDISVIHNFYYQFSLDTFAAMYWNSDKEKTKRFFEETRLLLRTKPSKVEFIEKENDILLRVPAIILVAKK